MTAYSRHGSTALIAVLVASFAGLGAIERRAITVPIAVVVG